MDANLILVGLAVVFGVMTILDRRKHGGAVTARQRTWLIVAGIFLLVSLYNWVVG